MSKRVAILALVLVGVLLAGVRTGVKTYTFTLSDQAMAGNAQLKPQASTISNWMDRKSC